MINPMTTVIPPKAEESTSRAIQLFEPPDDAVYTIEAAAHLVGLPRRTILVYCKHRLLSPVIDERGEGYSFDRDGIRSLRRIEALRMACSDDFAGIKIILHLTKELERLEAVVRFLSQNEWEPKPRDDSRSKSRNSLADRVNPQRYKRRT
jgi:DNA-binding transcriptional MerR regulator